MKGATQECTLIERRLAESLLFLETSRRSAGDKEYISAIRKLIVEHSQMRDALEQISRLTDISDIKMLASNVLMKSIYKNNIAHDTAIHEALLSLQKMLPSEAEVKKLAEARQLINKALQ